MIYQPYALESGAETSRYERYAVRLGGCGGRIIARDWGLDYTQAANLCELLEEARNGGIALVAATGTAKTPKAVECEASQSGPKGNAQPPSLSDRIEQLNQGGSK